MTIRKLNKKYYRVVKDGGCSDCVFHKKSNGVCKLQASYRICETANYDHYEEIIYFRGLLNLLNKIGIIKEFNH